MTEVKSLSAEALAGNLTRFSSVTPNLEQYESMLKEKNPMIGPITFYQLLTSVLATAYSYLNIGNNFNYILNSWS